jgi:hypothetical protein
MQKTIVKAITALAAVAVLVAGTGDGPLNFIVILASLAWLAFVAFATFRRRRTHE